MNASASQDSAATSLLGVNEKLVILLVDDQAMVAEAIRRMLETELDIELHYCQQPTEAIPMANAIKPSVILQDLVMPEVDGYTLLRFYRANSITANVPVIVLSSKEDPRDKSQAFSNGASDYLIKLPDKIELVARIRAHARSYLAQLQRDAAFQAMQALQEQLEESNRKLEESNAVLQRLSILDGLTGIANRRHFDNTLDQEWKRCSREQSMLSLILLDIDSFKKYNDNYGHQGGDECLRQVASALNKAMKRPGDFIARYGGEEFVAILPDTDNPGAAIIAEQMRIHVEELNIPHAYSLATDHVTISLGVATIIPDLNLDPKSLVEAADALLYRAKESGRNRYVAQEG